MSTAHTVDESNENEWLEKAAEECIKDLPERIKEILE